MRASIVLSLFIAVAANAQVTPEVTCWREDTNSGLTTIVFGYTNAGAPTTIPAGAENFVTPPPAVQSQPTLFESGQVPIAFTMSVATASESSASWTVSGSNVVFDRASTPACSITTCLCPAGAVGPPGQQGEQGPAGPPGIAGASGPAGPKGADGAEGPRGAEGPAGAAGAQGAKGPAGETGPAGPIGAIGAAGAAGANGVDGAPGPIGATGPAGPAGVTGPAGLAGVQGDVGAPGESGAVGARGPQGDAGPPGAAGNRGPQGPTGFAGPAGPPGAAGLPGVPGTDGAPGQGAIGGIADERITVDHAARLILIATATVRASSGRGSVQLVVDDVPRVSFAVSSPAATIPIMTTVDVSAGDHAVRIAGIDATVLTASVTVLVTDAQPVPRRRSVAH